MKSTKIAFVIKCLIITCVCVCVCVCVYRLIFFQVMVDKNNSRVNLYKHMLTVKVHYHHQTAVEKLFKKNFFFFNSSLFLFSDNNKVSFFK